jgi:hypothetical protein
MGMCTLHEKFLINQASNDHIHMLNVFINYQAYTQQAAFCDLEYLKTLSEKVMMLKALQQSLNFMCKFAFPQACVTCAKLLDAILSLQEFEVGEPHQIQLKLPNFDETFIFQRITLQSSLKKAPSTPAGASLQKLKTTQVSDEVYNKKLFIIIILYNSILWRINPKSRALITQKDTVDAVTNAIFSMNTLHHP